MGDKKTRLQFDFKPDSMDRIQEIKKRLDAGSYAEVVRRALRLLDYATIAEQNGEQITVGNKTLKII